MSLYATQYPQEVGDVDWLATSFKLIHLLCHSAIHIVPNYSPKDGLDHKKCMRIFLGITFGISRYIVMFIYAWRISSIFFVIQILIWLITAKMKFLGEMIKTTFSYVAVSIVMCGSFNGGQCSGMCYGVICGTILQLAGSGSFYLIGQIKGHYYKLWLREDDRAFLPYHVVADIGNAMWMLSTAYAPQAVGLPAISSIAFNNEFGVFPSCFSG